MQHSPIPKYLPIKMAELSSDTNMVMVKGLGSVTVQVNKKYTHQRNYR